MQFLDSNQINAVNLGTGPALIVAGPGSGKTTVITHHIYHLITKQNIPPDKILVITFTKAAALEMEQRFSNLSSNSYKVQFGTFHSVFLKFLKLFSQSDFSICSEEQKIEFITKLNLYNYSIEEFLGKVSYFKSKINLDVNKLEPEIYSYIKQYNKMLYDNNLIDYDDILLRCYYMFKDNISLINEIKSKYKAILIDEFQDINEVQYEIIKMISKDNVYAVGDPDQSIYSFRGSDSKIMNRFLNDFSHVKTIFLNTNYRSNLEIIEYSNSLIRNNTGRFDFGKTICKNSLANNAVNIEYFSSLSEEENELRLLLNEYSNEVTIGILFRNNKDVINYKQLFDNKNNYISDIKSYILYIIEEYLNVVLFDNYSSLCNIINIPNRRIFKKYLAKFHSIAELLNDKEDIRLISNIRIFYNQISLLKKMSPYTFYMYLMNIIGIKKYIESIYSEAKLRDKAFEEIESYINGFNSLFDLYNALVIFKSPDSTSSKKLKNTSNISFLTFHASKGLEFDIVILPLVNEGRVPSRGSINDAALLEEERRLLYVAMTRAKSKLYIFAINSNDFAPISRFMSEIKKGNG